MESKTEKIYLGKPNTLAEAEQQVRKYILFLTKVDFRKN